MSEVNEVSRRQFVTSAFYTAALAALPTPVADANVQKMKGDEIKLTAYLLFDGNCQNAMEFYRSCFGGDLTALKVKDSPARDRMPADQQDKILNARLKSGNLDISASDWLRPDRTP